MINSCSFGSITIGNKKINKDLIIYSNHINSNWLRKTGNFLIEADITEIINYKPEVLVIGTGASGLIKLMIS